MIITIAPDQGASSQADAGREQLSGQSTQHPDRSQQQGGSGKRGAEVLVEQELRKLERKIESQSRQHTVLPGEDDEDVEERGFRRQDVGPIKDVDPTHAAKRRAAWRAEDRRRNAVMDVSVIPSEIAAAEEDYDEPEEMFITDNIPVEPFNLRREREEGYFDDDGNYIEYRTDPQTRDAWLDLLDVDPNQQVQGELAVRLMQQAASTAKVSGARKGQKGMGGAGSSKQAAAMDVDQGEDQDQDEKDEDQGLGFPSDEPEQVWSKEDLMSFKSRMSALLLPGETPLAGLRRLAGPTDAPGQKPQASTAERQRALKQRHAQETHDADDAMGASKRAGTQPQAGQGSTIAEAQPATTPPVPSGGPQGQADTITGQGPGSGAVVNGGAVGSPVSGPRHSNRARYTNVEFDKLTEYADLLLGAGDFGVYTKTKEQLLAEVARTAARQSGRMLKAGTNPATSTAGPDAALQVLNSSGQLAAEGAQGSGVGDMESDDLGLLGRAEQLAAGLLGSAMKNVLAGEVVHAQDAHMAAPAHSSGQATHQAEVGSSAAGQEDVDIFAADDAPSVVGGDATAGPADGNQHRAGQALVMDNDTGQATASSLPAASNTAAALQPATDATGPTAAPGAITLTSFTENSSMAGQRAEGLSVATALAAGTGASSRSSHSGEHQGLSMIDVLGGFEPDPDSGLFYNSNMGLWYDPQRKLFMDANTGSWYRMNDGQQFEAAPDAGQGLPPPQAQPAPQPLPA